MLPINVNNQPSINEADIKTALHCILTMSSSIVYNNQVTPAAIIIFLPLMIAAIKLPNLYPEKYRSSAFKLNPFLLYFCAFTGIVMVLFFGIVIFIDLKTWLNIFGFFGFFISGVLYYVYRKRYLFKNKVDLNALIGKEDWDG